MGLFLWATVCFILKEGRWIWHVEKIRFVDGFVGFQSMGIIKWTAEIGILAIYLVTVDFSAVWVGGWAPLTWHVSFTVYMDQWIPRKDC